MTPQRTDARAELLCAAVLDESCACARGECTTTPTQPLLVLDLGTVTRHEVELVLPAGTYEAELCADAALDEAPSMGSSSECLRERQLTIDGRSRAR